MREIIVRMTEEYYKENLAKGYTLPELIRCKDCIKKNLCSIFRDAKQELGFCAWAERKEK